MHVASGRVYHVDYNPPKVVDRDDETGEPLIRREDDEEATVRHRLGVYESQTAPLKGYYRRWADSGDEAAPAYVRVDGIGDVEDITRRILAGIERTDTATT